MTSFILMTSDDNRVKSNNRYSFDKIFDCFIFWARLIIIEIFVKVIIFDFFVLLKSLF